MGPGSKGGHGKGQHEGWKWTKELFATNSPIQIHPVSSLLSSPFAGPESQDPKLQLRVMLLSYPGRSGWGNRTPLW